MEFLSIHDILESEINIGDNIYVWRIIEKNFRCYGFLPPCEVMISDIRSTYITTNVPNSCIIKGYKPGTNLQISNYSLGKYGPYHIFDNIEDAIESWNKKLNELIEELKKDYYKEDSKLKNFIIL